MFLSTAKNVTDYICRRQAFIGQITHYLQIYAAENGMISRFCTNSAQRLRLKILHIALGVSYK
jgi:hypothetical protein